MKNINICTIAGTVGGDADLAYSKAGKAICKFSVAHNRSRKNQQTGQWETVNTTWWRVSVFGIDAEPLAAQIKKGARVVVSGSAELNEYEGKDGVKRSDLQLMADSVSLVPDLRAGGAAQGGGKGDVWNSAQPEQAAFPEHGEPPF